MVLARSDTAIAQSNVRNCAVRPAPPPLDCVYCGQEHTSTKLCPEHPGEAVVARTEHQLATGRYRQLSLGWFGAEPLLGLDVIRAMTPRLRALAATNATAKTPRW